MYTSTFLKNNIVLLLQNERPDRHINDTKLGSQDVAILVKNKFWLPSTDIRKFDLHVITKNQLIKSLVFGRR